MKIRTWKQSDNREALYQFYNKTCPIIQYVPFSNVEALSETIFNHPDFRNEGLFLAEKNNQIVGIALAVIRHELYLNETLFDRPGFLALLIVEEAWQHQGIGSALLKHAMDYLKRNDIQNIQLSHKCPIKFPWNLDQGNAQHNKAPGIKASSDGCKFLCQRGFEIESIEVSYYLNLKNFHLSDSMKRERNQLANMGYTIDYFDSSCHFGQEEMFTRLKDESYRTKFQKAIKDKAKILVALKDNQRVCGTVGSIYPEENGRGFFQGLAIDPKDSGLKIGNTLFFRLCEELKAQGARYMTLFVSEGNFAKKIYERAGFTAVQRWAILRLEKEKDNE